jgi:hypothetical protein
METKLRLNLSILDVLVWTVFCCFFSARLWREVAYRQDQTVTDGTSSVGVGV